MTYSPYLLSANTMIGDEVRNNQGDDLGKIEDLMVDVSSSRVAYAVLSFGGFMGIGDKLFAVPLEALKFDTDENCFVLDVDKQQLKNAPGFDKDNWPDMADPTWASSVHTYYHVDPYWERRM